MSSLSGKVALVTGASRGIGEAIAKTLAAAGATVAGCSTRAEGSQPTVESIIAAGGQAKAYGVNVADAAAVNATVQAVLADFGRIDLLVNNAGITRDGLLMRMSDDDFDEVIAVDLKGVFNFIRACARPMIKNRGGSIVNLASVVGLTGNAGQANYTAAKGGVIALTKTVAQELGSRNVRCNAVAPGFIRTQMTEALPEAVKAKCLDQIPLKRFGEVEDVARVVAWLGSDDSSYVTGQVISVNGGMFG